ncbi:MAG: OmpA family protein, partial [Prolixibacteraceae bacterium]
KQAKDICYEILERDSNFVDAHLLLADIYHATDSLRQEIKQLEKAKKKVEMDHVYYRLGNAYYLTGNYQNALANFEQYLNATETSSGRTSEISRKVENCRFAIEAKKNPVDFHPERLSDNVNTDNDEYWPNLSIDQQELVFTRLIKRPGYFPQEDFYISELDSAGWGVARPIVEINTPENEGAQIISADGRIMFFTACNRPGGKGSCDIYYSRWINGRWSAPMNAGEEINTNYWEAQPAFSSDNRYFYFSSNRPGGKGKKDIWRAEFKGFGKHGNAKWGKPKNMGPKINTAGDEISPFVHPNNKNFYFASDFHTGMGGSDVFMAEINHDSIISSPENLGYPVNTFNNEQGLFISADGRIALFSSARNEQTGLDIYSFRLDEDIRPEPVTYLNARVIDAKTKQPVKAILELVNLTDDNRIKREEVTDKNGEILLVLPVGANYAFSVSKEGYLFFSESFALNDSKGIYDPYDLLIELKPIEVGSEMNLYNVYFETDSFRILPESESELQKLVTFLKNNPGLKVEIQGHTDNTGSAAFNQKLSELRAQSVVDYLVRNGINKVRLNFAGYGAGKPVATNETPEGRRLNRRTTIRILSKE